MDDRGGNRATLIRQPAPLTGGEGEGAGRNERSPGWKATNLAVLGLLCAVFAPAVAPLFCAAAVVRGAKLLWSGESGLGASLALVVGTAAGLCSLIFWLVWVMMRPAPVVLLEGWAGLKGLPAAPIGFQRTPDDPFGFTPGSWRSPHSRG